MKRFKVVIQISVFIAILVLTGYKLRQNKVEMAEEAAMAKVTAEAIPVSAKEAVMKNLSKNYDFHGIIRPAKELMVISEAKGKVMHVFKEKGELVSKGEVIAQLDDELLTEQYRLAQVTVDKLEKDRKRFRELVKGNAVTDQKSEEVELSYQNAIAQLAMTKRYLADTQIKAPISGLINDDYIEEGQFIAAGNKICEIIDIKNLKIRIEVAEEEQKVLQVGQMAQVTSFLYPESAINATVTWISAKAGQGLKYGVELAMANTPQKSLKGGMFTTVRFSGDRSDRLVIPRKAVSGSLKEPHVFVVNDNKVENREVQIGLVNPDYVEIIAGIDAGDLVVTAGQINLQDQTIVQVN